MYRSQSSSSVFFDGLINCDSHSPRNISQEESSYSPSPSELLCRSLAPKSSDDPSSRVNMETLTSALTGSKMATQIQLPTGTGKKPLPRALLPKVARSPASPLTMGGTAFASIPPMPSSDLRKGSYSGPTNQALTRSQASVTGWKGGRCHSISSGSSLSRSTSGSISSGRSLTNSSSDQRARETPLEAATRTAPQGLARPRVDFSASGRRGDTGVSVVKTRPQSVGYDPRSCPPVVIRPTRRREPVVQDSIYPMLRAALGKDTHCSGKMSEEEAKRQVLDHRTFTSIPPTPLAQSKNIYSSMDDVFEESVTSSTGNATLPRNHFKSHSEVLPSREFDFLPARPWSRDLAHSSGNIPSFLASTARTTSTTRNVPQMEFSPSGKDTSTDVLNNFLPSSSSSSTFSPPPPPLPSNPPPLSPSNTAAPSGQSFETDQWSKLPSSNTKDCEVTWYNPILVGSRKTIRIPSVVMETPQKAKGGRSTGSLPLFGDNFSSDDFPLLSKVERIDLDGDGEFVSTPGSKTNGTSSSTCGSVQLSSKHSSSGVIPLENNPLPPPVGFQDETSAPLDQLTTTTYCPTAKARWSVSHQAQDSINTEDSGLDRWEKDGIDHSADELDTGHSTTALVERSYAEVKRRNGHWQEDLSEGRGSLSSSPRPLSMDDQWPSSTEEIYSRASDTGNHGDEKPLPRHSILGQLLATNARLNLSQSHPSLDQEASAGSPKLLEKNTPSSLTSIHRPPSEFDSQSSVSGGAIDSESNNSFSTAVQSTVTASCGTLESGDEYRSTDYLSRGTSSTLDFDHETKTPALGLTENPDGAGHSTREQRLEISQAWNRSPRFNGFNGAIEARNSSVEASPKCDDVLNHLRAKEEGTAEDREGYMDKEDGQRMVFQIAKSPVGVGFCIEGGKGSLSGDRPIVVKRLFKGVLSEGTVNLCPGDELLSIGSQSLVGFSHYDAWKYIKALPNGTTQVVIRRRKTQLLPP